MTTSVPTLTFGPLGFVPPTEAQILAGVQLDQNAAFGGNLNPSLTTPTGQLAQSTAAMIGNCYDQEAQLFNSVDPNYASGRMQDALGYIYFLTRIPATATLVSQCVCTGLPGTVIPVNAQAQDSSGNLYLSTESAVIGTSGSVTIPFQCATTGPITCPIGALSTIYQAIPGWDSILNSSAGVVGTNVESRYAFELRRQQSVANNSLQIAQAIQGAVLAVPGVIDAYTYDNGTSGPVVVGGVTIAANSLYICVAGGVDTAVAQAIWAKKGPGCPYQGVSTVTASISGNTLTIGATLSGAVAIGQQIFDTSGLVRSGTTITAGSGSSWTTSGATQTVASETMYLVSTHGVLVQDTNSGYQPPYPAYVVAFTLPTSVPIAFAVTIANSTGVPSTALSLVQGAIQSSFAGNDGGSRARIGSRIFASRFYANVAALGSWAQIISIQIGSPLTSGASFTGTISGTTLTVSGVTGTIAIGQVLMDYTGNVIPGTTITAGSGTTWTVSNSQTVSVGETMYGVVPNNTSQTMNINNLPTLDARNITLTLV